MSRAIGRRRPVASSQRSTRYVAVIDSSDGTAKRASHCPSGGM
jgi:hypothetical protein